MRDTQPDLCALNASRAKRLLFALCFSLLFLATSSPSRANQGLSLEATAGHDGYARSGSWIPVTVLLENNGREVQGDLVAFPSSRAQGAATRRSIRVPAGARQRHHLLVHVSQRGQSIHIGFQDVATEVSVREIDEHDLSPPRPSAPASSAFRGPRRPAWRVSLPTIGPIAHRRGRPSPIPRLLGRCAALGTTPARLSMEQRRR